MPLRHFRTFDGIFITFDDVKYTLNSYNAENETADITRLQDNFRVVVIQKGIGTEFRDTTGVTTGTFLGIPRIVLP